MPVSCAIVASTSGRVTREPSCAIARCIESFNRSSTGARHLTRAQIVPGEIRHRLQRFRLDAQLEVLLDP